MILLGVNIDHVATVRQARGTFYPDPLQAALLAIHGGADGITMHLREDRRHIQDEDVVRVKKEISVPLNLEMAATEEMLRIATEIQPAHCCLVPEKRQEITTEGGLDVLSQQKWLQQVCARLAAAGIEVSLFIDPDLEQIKASVDCGAPTIEIHTGSYAEAETTKMRAAELEKIITAAEFAAQQGLIVNAGHGLNCANVQPIAAIPKMNELNIGHALIADALFVGLDNAVRVMKGLMLQARQ